MGSPEAGEATGCREGAEQPTRLNHDLPHHHRPCGPRWVLGHHGLHMEGPDVVRPGVEHAGVLGNPDHPPPMIDTFIQDTLAILAKRPAMAPTGSLVRPGSLWVSKTTHRRGRVSWASGGLVRLEYAEQPNAYKVMAQADLLKYYNEIH